MKSQELQNVVAGFTHEAFGSQAVFRTSLNALSYPGRPLEMPLDCALPGQGQGAAVALLLGLLDSDTTLWMSPSVLHSDATPWLCFHTGCKVVEDVSAAQFIWVAYGDSLPQMSSLMLGSDAYPDQSATCIIETQGFDTDVTDLVLKGPGIEGERTLKALGLPDAFLEQWTNNQGIFPRGVDVFLTDATHIVGLPRTTRISRKAKA
ncbi:MAG: phosphonate C-P lyase system protein PhnH [Burkholderiales bacterium]|nr:phosphonate C-P lyase system protein PhnH [Burkholderiales bacterium]